MSFASAIAASVPTVLASADSPSAGAPIVQIAEATVFATVVTALLLTLILRERSGRSTLLTRAAAHASKRLNMEPWAALPYLVGTVALISGGFGVFWDISLHIDTGRDPGPLANPAHYFILLALYGLFAAGLLSLALHERAEHPSPSALTLPGGLRVPVGGALLLTCGGFALTGFPLDDLWHRMFGQDVTLWGPTHLVMINGAILSVPVLAVLGLESRRARGGSLTGTPTTVLAHIQRLMLPGALLFAISFWATEFDWGVPQYRMIWQPLLLAFAGGMALTGGRVWIGRGGAAGTLVFYLVLRGALELVLMGFGRSVPAMPIFVVEALLIEALAWGMRLERGDTPSLRFGAGAGLICGTAGFAAAYAWTHVWSNVPWNEHMIGGGLPTAAVAGIAGGVLGSLLGAGLRGDLPARPVRRRAGLGAALAVIALGANALWVTNPQDLTASVALASSGDAAHREAVVTARFSDAGLARRAQMVQVLAWQGGGSVVARMREVAPGVWRSDRPVPLHGDWKTNLRLQSGRAFVALPLHLPREPSVPTPGLVRPAHFRATFVSDVAAMQTERRDYVPGWIWTPAALLMLAFCMAFVTAIALGVARIADAGTGRHTPPAAGRRGARSDTALAMGTLLP